MDLDQFVEGWGNQSVAFQYVYSLKIFKDVYKLWINMHHSIVSDRKVLPIKEVISREEKAGIILPSISNKIEW